MRSKNILSLLSIAVICLFISPLNIFAASHEQGPTTTVENYMGLPTFMVDGEPHMSRSFETYVPELKYYRQFAQAGATVMGVPVNCGEEPWWHSTPVWVGPDVWDYTELDESIGKIIAADPNALILPRVHVAEPDWWREKYPAEVIVYDDGTTDFLNPHRLWPALKSKTWPSFASQQWRNDMCIALRKFIEHVQSKPYAKNIFGYQILGGSTEEWYHYGSSEKQLGDYSVHMKIYFQNWLRKKYWTAESLQKAWNNPNITFDKVTIPTRQERYATKNKSPFLDPAAQMNVIDYYTCYQEIVPDVIDMLCKTAKDATGRKKVIGAFYAYMYEFGGNQESGHMAVQKLLQSQNVDFVVVTASYGSRQLGSGGSILRSPHTSMALHGKLWYEDNDTVSFLFPEVSQRMGDAEWERSKDVLAATDSAEESKWIYQRGAGFVLGNGIYQALFDLHGGYYDNPELLQSVKEIYNIFENSKKYDRTSCSQILVIADELSTMYCTPRSGILGQNLYDPPYRLIKCGAPYDSIYLNDLALLDTTPYKLVIMLNTFHIDDYQQSLIEQKLKNSGKTVLWVYAPGIFNGNKTDFDRISKITGIETSVDADKSMIAPKIKLQKQTNTFADELLKAKFETIGNDYKSCFLIYANDKNAKSLGIEPKSGKTVLAVKNMGSWTSVYSITASLPIDFYRAIARSAGVHIYNEKNDTTYVSKSYLTVNADGPGVRKLSFPKKTTVYDAVTEQILAENVTNFELNLKNKETKILRINQ
jgi:hypothetical protein